MPVRDDILRLVDELAADERGITTAAIRERLGISEQSASNMMSRLVKAGLLDRVAWGVFAPRPLGQLGTRAASEDVALAVGAAFSSEQHHIAFRSALDYHGLLIHPARTIQVAMPRRVKISRISGRRFQPVLESANTIAIGAQEAGHGAKVSNKERALLESASRPSLVGGWTTLATALTQSSYDPEKLAQLAEQLNAGAALRRIASLADVNGVADLPAALAPPTANARLVLLDPQEPMEEPWTDRRWRVRWPTSRQQARELIAN